MKIKELIDRVRSKLSSEELEQVNSLLSEIARAEAEILADRSAANEESKNRKNKIRELETTIEEINGKLEAANNTIADNETKTKELEEYKTKWESAKIEREKNNLEKWNKLKTRFDVKETDSNYDKVQKLKSYYVFDEEITPEQIQKNLELMKRDEDLGLFSTDERKPPDMKKGDEKTPDGKKALNQFI